jgi:hypothetical protein
VCVRLFAGRTVQTVAEDLRHLMDKYGSSPALLRIRGLPVYFMYDSYRIPADAWAKLLLPNGEISVRGTPLDGGWVRGGGGGVNQGQRGIQGTLSAEGHRQGSIETFIPADAWAKLLLQNGEISVRGRPWTVGGSGGGEGVCESGSIQGTLSVEGRRQGSIETFIPADAWPKLLLPNGELSIRGTPLDGGWVSGVGEG